MKLTLKKDAFETWLKDSSKNSAEVAALILCKMLSQNPDPNNVVWDLIKETGDRFYTFDTFLKAAKTCLDKPDNSDVVRVEK